MAVRNDLIVFVTMLLTLTVASSEEPQIVTASISDDFDHHLGCKGDNASKLGACYNPEENRNNDACGHEATVTCVEAGGGGANPCNGRSVSVVFVGPCKAAYDANIQLSSIAYYSIVLRDKDSGFIRVKIVFTTLKPLSTLG